MKNMILIKFYFTVLLSVSLIFAGSALSASGQKPVLIGGGGGEGALFMPYQVEEGPDGNIYVAEAREVCIKVFQPDGQFLRKISRPGQGPGDILRMGSFGFSDNETLFTTEMINGNRWINFFDLSGKFLRVLKLEVKGSWGLFRAKSLPGNRLLGEFHFWGSAEKISRYYGLTYPQWLAVIEPDGKISKTPVQKNHIFSVSYEPNKGDKRIPYFPNFLWALDEQQRILFSEGDGNTWQKMDLDGKILETVKTALPDAPVVTREDISRWKEELKNSVVKRSGLQTYKQYFTVIEDYKDSIYGKKPVYTEMTLTAGGNILILQDSFIAPGGVATAARYWLLDKKGKVILQWPGKATALRVTKNFILFIGENEDGEREVHCTTYKGAEVEALKRLAAM